MQVVVGVILDGDFVDHRLGVVVIVAPFWTLILHGYELLYSDNV